MIMAGSLISWYSLLNIISKRFRRKQHITDDKMVTVLNQYEKEIYKLV